MAKAKKKVAKKPVAKKKVAKKPAPKQKAKCAAKTKSGKACRNYAVGRSKYCLMHQKKKK